MAYKKKMRKTRPRFRKRKANPTVAALKAAIVPDRLIVRLPYVNQANITGTMGANIDTQYRLNSIYDPEVATGLGQNKAIGVNQWGAFYNRYRVIGANVYFMARNTNADAAFVGICANNDTTGLTTEGAFEQSRVKFKMIGANTGGHDVVVLKKYFNLSNLTGRPKVSYISDDRYQSIMTDNPAEAIHLHLLTQPASPSLSVSLHTIVKIVYLVELFDRKSLDQSL